MPFYETVFIARQDFTDVQVKELSDGYQKIITDAGGKIHRIENWGLRSLAYKIQKNKRGHYVAIEMDAPAPAIHEMERTMRLNEDILRFMTIRNNELSKGASVVMDKSSRDTGEESDEKKPYKRREAA